MTLEEVAKQTDCSVATVHRELAYARAFLIRSGISITAEAHRPPLRQPSVDPSETVPRRGPEAILALSPATARGEPLFARNHLPRRQKFFSKKSEKNRPLVRNRCLEGCLPRS
jgi:hypothetical protein